MTKEDQLERLREAVEDPAAISEDGRRDLTLQTLVYAEELRELVRKEKKRAEELEGAKRSLEEAAERMRQLDRAREEFIANCSHELRTPLTPIIGWAEVLSRQVRPPEETQELAATIAAQGKRLLAVVDSLLKVAAIRRDFKRRVEPEDVDLEAVLRESEAMAASRGRSTEVSVEEQAARVDSERAFLIEVMGFLVDNALKFTPDQSPITLRATREGPEVIVEVVDRGPGLPDDREAIFEAFRQGDASSTRAHGGLGLGLYLSKQFVEAHGGRIWAEDTPRGGATFGFSIPQRRASDGD